MKKPTTKFILTAILLLVAIATTAEAKLVLTEQELKQKITDHHISDIYLVDGGIGGLEKNQYGLTSDEIIVIGSYEKIPDDIYKLAQQHNVNVLESQRWIHKETRPYAFILPLISWGLNITFFVVIITLMIIINKKLSKIKDSLDSLSKK